MREFLSQIPEYEDTPIWITEIGLHIGYDSWKFEGAGMKPVGAYNWDKMSDYLESTLSWLTDNSEPLNISRWFFYTTYKDIINPAPDGYMGITFFSGPEIGSHLNCLGAQYQSWSLDTAKTKCSPTGEIILD